MDGAFFVVSSQAGMGKKEGLCQDFGVLEIDEMDLGTVMEVEVVREGESIKISSGVRA